jgi:uncharacterized cupin superfamily protein
MQLAPGCNTKPAHYHSREEEHLFAFKGTATPELDGKSLQLVSGSYICFPAAQAASHYLHNTGKAPFWYLMIGQRDGEDEVTYPSEPTRGAPESDDPIG